MFFHVLQMYTFLVLAACRAHHLSPLFYLSHQPYYGYSPLLHLSLAQLCCSPGLRAGSVRRSAGGREGADDGRHKHGEQWIRAVVDLGRVLDDTTGLLIACRCLQVSHFALEVRKTAVAWECPSIFHDDQNSNTSHTTSLPPPLSPSTQSTPVRTRLSYRTTGNATTNSAVGQLRSLAPATPPWSSPLPPLRPLGV